MRRGASSEQALDSPGLSYRQRVVRKDHATLINAVDCPSLTHVAKMLDRDDEGIEGRELEVMTLAMLVRLERLVVAVEELVDAVPQGTRDVSDLLDEGCGLTK